MSTSDKAGAVELPVQHAGHSTRSHLRDFVWIAAATLLAGFLLRTFVVGVVRVPSASMAGTLLPGDFVLLSKLPTPTFTSPAIGDVVALRLNLADSRTATPVSVTLLKRCVALAGDTLVIRDGRFIVNGREIILPPTALWLLPPKEMRQSGGDELGPFVVPRAGDRLRLTPENVAQWQTVLEREGRGCAVDGSGRVVVDGRPESTYVVRKKYLFVVGDNESLSIDSRSLGYIPEDAVIGKAIFVFWSVASRGFRHDNPSEEEGIRWRRIGTFIR